LLVINDTSTTTTTTMHLEDGVIVVIPVSLEIVVTTFTSIALEGRTRSLGTTRTLFIGLAGVMVVIPTTLVKTIIAT